MAFSVTGSTAITTSGNSLIVPLDALEDFGLNSAEYSNSAANLQRAMFAMLKALQTQALTGILGITRAALTQTLVSPNLINNSFSWSFDRLANLTANTVGQIPLPTTGTNNGIGGLSLADFFTGSTVRVVANNTSITDSLIMPLSDLSPLGYNPSTGNLSAGSDDRLFYRALLQYLTSSSQFSPRATNTVSAVTTRAVGTVGLVGLPAGATDSTNPTTGITPGDNVASLRQSYSLTFQQTINQASDTIDINFI